MFNNIYDLHLHSDNSFDGNDSCIDLCRSAVEKGLKGIAITDHCDIDGMLDKCYDFQDKQFSECMHAQELFSDQLKIYTGVELGQGIYVKELSESFLEKYDFDIVIGSIHNLENMEDFYFLDYSKYDIKELLNLYFNDILELAKWNKTDTIAHLTYPLRYIVAREKIDVDLSYYYDIIDKIFNTLIENNKALEINVSGLSMDINDTLPPKELIERYHNMGGKYVTIGSDSHFADKVGKDIDKGLKLLKSCGYTHYTVFEKRKPVLVEII